MAALVGSGDGCSPTKSCSNSPKDKVAETSSAPCSPARGSEGKVGGATTNGFPKELKNQFISPDELEYDHLQTELRGRLEEGKGETIYEVGGGGCMTGLNTEDMRASLTTVRALAASCEADVVVLREKTMKDGCCIVHCLVRKRVAEEDFMEIRVAVVGNVDAGKSTLLGVLTHGEMDNGRGLARQKLFRHKHEMESGRTSSVGNDILGFSPDGTVVNKTDGHGSLDWVHICKAASKVVTFIDLAGHERYLKTTIFGMTGHAPDFCMLMVGSNAGIIGMTKEHLGLALALSVPVFVVVTKIDMCPPNVLQDTLKLLNRILKSPGSRKIPVMVQTDDDVITAAVNFTSERICPIFQVSNVDGTNLDKLRIFLNLLSGRMRSNEDKPAEFQIDETYSVPGVGTVVSGTCMQGMIRMNDSLLLGPTSLGEFIPVTIRGIHRKRMPVKEVRGGQTASFALKKIRRNQIRKGMVMVAMTEHPAACWEFEGDILVLHHPTTISTKYQAMVHCGSSKQTASIVSMNKKHLRTGDKATCLFRFIKNPEYLRPGTRMVFREGRTKAVGNVTKIFPHAHGHGGPHQGHKSKASAIQHSHPPPGGVGRVRSKGKGRRGGRKRAGLKAAAVVAVVEACGGTTRTDQASTVPPDVESVPSKDSPAHATISPT